MQNIHWQPTAKLSALQARAEMYAQIRQFFAEREVLEVDTPLMCARSITDPYIQPFVVEGKYYLQTSPEYAMKRLIADGVGSVYQICKAFRQEESGNNHNPEFTMLEWYRMGFDHKQLIAEMDALLQLLFATTEPAKKSSYHDIFQEFVGINPHTASLDQLKECAFDHNINLSPSVISELNITDWLQLLMSHVIEPQFIGSVPWIIYDFPVPQAALSRVFTDERNQLVAGRFEVYMQGVELANGYYESLDPIELNNRFIRDNERRRELNLNIHASDERLLAAMQAGFPECAGVSLGLDRVLMLKLGVKSINEVIAFPIERA